MSRSDHYFVILFELGALSPGSPLIEGGTGMAETPAPGSGRGEDPAGGPVPGFASGGRLDTALPGAALTQDLDQASGTAALAAFGLPPDEALAAAAEWAACGAKYPIVL